MTRWTAPALIVLWSVPGAPPACAQDAADTIAVPAVSEPVAVAKASAIWVAGVSGGVMERDSTATSPYAVASLTRYAGNGYLRVALTGFRSTLQQVDAALPSTYLFGSLGAGGTWNGWVVDGFISYGTQRFGLVRTDLGARRSTAGNGASYAALGGRAGRIVTLDPRTTLTATASGQFMRSASLRHVIQPTGPQDLRLNDRALTGSLALRVDRVLGSRGTSVIGITAEHFVTDNGTSQVSGGGALSGALGRPPTQPGNTTVPVSLQRYPDGWDELGVSGTVQVGGRVWLDFELRRTFGALAGNATIAGGGLRWRF